MKTITASTQLRQDALRDIRQARKRQQAVHLHRAHLNKVMRTLRAINPDGVRVFAYGGALPEILFRLDIDGLDSLKSPTLVKALERIERASGITFDRTWDLATTIPSREIRGTYRLEPRLDIEIVVNASVKADAPNCRRVKTGERVHVEPVYEIQCD